MNKKPGEQTVLAAREYKRGRALRVVEIDLANFFDEVSDDFLMARSLTTKLARTFCA